MRRLSQEQRWFQGYAELEDYVATHGHANVPFAYISPTGYKLGSWVNTQRTRWGNLPTKRQELLQKLPGWVLDVYELAWQNGYAELQTFVATHGHANVPGAYISPTGYKLGQWVKVQRNCWSNLSPHRQRLLKLLPGWVLNALEAAWQNGYVELQTFVATHGHANVLQAHISPTGYKLGQWVSTQRVQWSGLFPHRQRLLKQLAGWVLDAPEAAWQEGFAELQTFVATHGHANVPARYISPTGYNLGQWVNKQRSANRKKTLRAHRRAQLTSIPGWLWHVR